MESRAAVLFAAAGPLGRLYYYKRTERPGGGRKKWFARKPWGMAYLCRAAGSRFGPPAPYDPHLRRHPLARF
jgi:hypothetical protein